MNVAAAARARRGINRRGHPVIFRRMASSIDPITKKQSVEVEATVKIVGQGYSIGELTNGVTIGTRKVIVSRLDLEAAGFPALRLGDRIYLGVEGETPIEIAAVDAEHREYNGCYDLTIRGK